MQYADHLPAPPRFSLTAEPVLLALVAVAHVCLMTLLVWQTHSSTPAKVDVLSVRFIQAAPPVDAPVKPQVTPPKPQPPKPEQKKPEVARVKTEQAMPAPAIKPEPQPEPEPEPQPEPEPVQKPKESEPALAPPVVPPRFDAAYLNNPTPAYPALSRRNGETGRVLLRVLVSRQGKAAQVTLLESSGYARLDSAAQAAVRDWRFVPAQQGDASVEEWVQVPVHFKLTR